MKKDREIVVIMCVYINDKLPDLQESLVSLYRQSFNEFDIFIQCDGIISNDMKIYLDSEVENGHIKLLRDRDVNFGLAASLNELLELAISMKYKYFARMDADDICNSDRIKKQFRFMEDNPSIDVVGSDIVEFYDDGFEKLVTYSNAHEEIKSHFAKKTALAHVTAFFRRSFFEKSGLYNISSNRNEDQWLWLSGFLNECNFASFPEPLVNVRISTDLLFRRGEFKHNWDTFLLRNSIIFKLKFSIFYYFYNFIIFLIKNLPFQILKLIYKVR